MCLILNLSNDLNVAQYFLVLAYQDALVQCMLLPITFINKI